ncbi:PAS domain-containing protein [Hyphomicrobium sp.]|uniref:PAS domain-containing protein n=1 Tax=Hyphomicrobium sp. TaxID=82 RepID=UPI002E37DBA2|nr:PAS domain-containing protein [Hyphomicrobium sp.]HEX2841549.1 PAS domain-containing protein [Hyphomicrobium sp.]
MSSSPDGEAPFLESVLGRMNGFLYRCRADREFTMLELTSGFQRCFGFDASEVLGNRVRSFASLIHPDDGAAVDLAVVQGLGRRKNWTINYRLLHSAGHYVWVHEDGGGVWDEAGGLVFLEGAVFDMHHLYASLESQFNAGAAREG